MDLAKKYKNIEKGKIGAAAGGAGLHRNQMLSEL